MSNDDLINECLERISMFEKEVNRMKSMIVKLQSGEYITFDEAFKYEVMLESSSDEAKCYSLMTVVIEHLLKIKYCTNNRNINHWSKKVKDKREKISNKTLWFSSKKKYRNLIKYMENELPNIYEDAVNRYEKDSREYSDLIDGLDYIPEKCPWKFENLMDDSIEELISILP